MGKFCQILTELSANDTSVFSFPDDNFSKYQWIFTKLGMCIDVVETWYGIADGQIPLIFVSVICTRHVRISFLDDNFSKYQWVFTKLYVH